LNNSNTLKLPSFVTLNLNLHYGTEFKGNFFKGVEAYFDAHNLTDKRYSDSGVVVSDSPTDTAASLFTNKFAYFAAAPRSFFGGIRLKF
jgi:iron complex outermembrane receptor protein